MVNETPGSCSSSSSHSSSKSLSELIAKDSIEEISVESISLAVCIESHELGAWIGSTSGEHDGAIRASSVEILVL